MMNAQPMRDLASGTSRMRSVAASATAVRSEFVALARPVYKSDDHRAALKRKINELLGLVIVEEKSYSSALAAVNESGVG